VTPGTKFITVGGAIASDVHGKNHHKEGCFSECLVAFHLMLPDGTIVRCNRNGSEELFRATCGGMGLTGVVLDATFRLRQVQSAYIRETVLRAANLEEIFSLFEQHQTATYSVAWIDCLAKGKSLGRSLLMLGEHSDSGPLTLPAAPRYSVPVNFPGICLNRHSVSLFNHLYYKTKPAPVEGRPVHLDPFFYPLDAISNWNRMYGRSGFAQYQLVLPKESSFEGLQAILHRISRAGLGSFLGVLKLLGPSNENMLSFPTKGYTLALDFRIQKRLFPLFDELDRVVLDHGGRLYLAKDARMSRAVFRQGYPQWEGFIRLREKLGMKSKMNSLQSKRLGV
jgi:FAD/FMN-containing dehydrogenase